MNPTFVLADSSHADLLIKLMREFYQVEHLKFDEGVARSALQQILGNRAHGLIHVIGLGEEVVGYVVLTFGFSLEFHGRDALVDEIYVREEYRGRGVGRAALRFVEDVCQDEGIKALHLEVDRVNTKAQKLYSGAGYEDNGRYLMTKWVKEK